MGVEQFVCTGYHVQFLALSIDLDQTDLSAWALLASPIIQARQDDCFDAIGGFRV